MKLVRDIEGIRVLAAQLEGVPHLDMGSFTHYDCLVRHNPMARPRDVSPGCGTVACAIGWYLLTPEAHAKGFEWSKNGLAGNYKGKYIGFWSIPKFAFGLTEDEADLLFSGLNEQEHDLFDHLPPEQIDLAAFRARVIMLLDTLQLPVNPEYRRVSTNDLNDENL